MPIKSYWKRIRTLGAISLFALALVPGQAQQAVYDGQLATGWANYSWAQTKLGDTTLLHGTHSAISVTIATGSYGALELRSAPFDASQYNAIEFWINGGPIGGQGDLVVKASVDGKQQSGVGIPMPKANTWTLVTVPLSDLGVSKAPNMTGFLIQENSPSAAPMFYVSDITLTTAGAAGPTKLAAEQAPTFVHHGSVNPLPFTGVNISGGEFDNPKRGATTKVGTNYVFPSSSELSYFAAHGANIMRLPFHWADVQRDLKLPLNKPVLDALKAVVADANRQGITVVLDPHDYARYYGDVVGSDKVPADAFADFWGRMAHEFANNPKVWFGLMNEPHDMPKEQWLTASNAAILAIRQAGAKNLILVPGIDWTGAYSWVGSGNAETMIKTVDPINHYIFEVHQYLDSNNSGTHLEAVSATIGSERLQEFTQWSRLHNRRAFLGEFGAANNPTAASATDDMLNYMEKNRDVWFGFTWWSAGAWWGDYMYTLEPKNGQDRPQMAFVRPHLQIKPVK